jgi:hypothetical protein
MIADILSAARYERTSLPSWQRVEVDVPPGAEASAVLDALAEKHMTVVPVFRDGETSVVAKVCG